MASHIVLSHPHIIIHLDPHYFLELPMVVRCWSPLIASRAGARGWADVKVSSLPASAPELRPDSRPSQITFTLQIETNLYF